MNIGILGTGFGAYHAELYKQSPLVGAVKVWGRNGAKREALAQRLGIQAAGSMRELLEDPEIDLIDICLPNALHRDAILAALECGKPVFCETPACTTIEDLEAVQAAILKCNGRVYVNQFIKFFPEYRYVHDAAASGEYGKLLSLRVWRKTPAIWGELGFGTISTSLMIHDLDFATWVLGAPEDIAASGTQKSSRECCVNASYARGGSSVMVSASSMMPHSYLFAAGFEADFEHAAIEFSGQFPDGEPVKHMLLYTDSGKKELTLPPVDPYAAAIGHVMDCRIHDKPAEIGFECAVASIRSAISIRESLRILGNGQ